jgi:hypothetical protein
MPMAIMIDHACRDGSMWTSALVGVASSFVATVIWAIVTVLAARLVRNHRADRFVGKYSMFLNRGLTATGGTVRIEQEERAAMLFSASPVLTIFAEHGIGTEDWKATVQVLGFSDTATGYYAYQNRTGGSLRLELSSDPDEITEYGTPFDSGSSPFIRILKRDG